MIKMEIKIKTKIQGYPKCEPRQFRIRIPKSLIDNNILHLEQEYEISFNIFNEKVEKI